MSISRNVEQPFYRAESAKVSIEKLLSYADRLKTRSSSRVALRLPMQTGANRRSSYGERRGVRMSSAVIGYPPCASGDRIGRTCGISSTGSAADYRFPCQHLPVCIM